MGRSTQGVRLINLDEGEKLAGLEKIDEPENGDDPAGPAAPAAPAAQ
jgi:DNA gyrase subunit A